MNIRQGLYLCRKKTISLQNKQNEELTKSSYCYQGSLRKKPDEISPEVENLIQCDFRASRPNIKWITDTTGFSIPDKELD
ncbi:hypothetical protein CBFG_03616 [Clostridiales bacterium 1_7_47FAA]|nr:hypothetical protein CBFG_03616 [Clostridiales bacterium 1_7_47FAA]